jgi:hypothetical protein
MVTMQAAISVEALQEPQSDRYGPLSLSLSPSEGERVPQTGEGAVQGFKARIRSGNSLPLRGGEGRGERAVCRAEEREEAGRVHR